MLFCDRLSEQEVREAKTADRASLLELLLGDFRKAFPDLTFELQLDFAIINAQARRQLHWRTTSGALRTLVLFVKHGIALSLAL